MESTTITLSEERKFNIAKALKNKLNIKVDFGNSLKKLAITFVSVAIFLGAWQLGSSYLFQVEADSRIAKALSEQGPAEAETLKACIASGETSCQPNTLPSPLQVWAAGNALILDHQIIKNKKADFAAEVAAVNSQRKAQGLPVITYTGRPSFVNQITTSLKTVFVGCLIAFFIAVPIGIFMGLNENIRTAFNWLIQILKPVSPVVWLLLVFMIVKTLTLNSDVDSSFIISAISVGLCAMWPTLVNTSVGVSSVNKDYINVSKVLNLSIGKKIFKIVLPSAIPLIFTGIRITVSVAWMVLIAIELLAQSPGLGSFVWEEFQNGANDSNAKILVAMFVIGLIGFLLDRIMFWVQQSMSFEKAIS